jgi:hypothetical protein
MNHLIFNSRHNQFFISLDRLSELVPNDVMAMQALPPAEAIVIRTPAHAHETVNTKDNGILPYKIGPKTVLKSPQCP